MIPAPVILALWAAGVPRPRPARRRPARPRGGHADRLWRHPGAFLAATAVAGLALAGAPSAAVLPVGLPWIGAHFRIDALSAFFLLVIDLGGAAASLYALGYGRHEHEPGRVLPFFPAFLAGMNLVLMADDAFAFLVAWEFMSLSSWALVMAHHAEAGNARAGYIYILMASFGTFALLLAFGLLAGPEAIMISPPSGRRPRAGAGQRRARPRPARHGIEGRPGAAPCLAAARPSRRPPMSPR